MAKNVVTLTFAGDSASLERALGRLKGQTDQTSSRFTRFARAAKVGAIAVFGGLAVAAKRGFDEMKAGQAVSAQTAAALKSTGGAAGVTQSHIEGLAQKLSNLSGADDQAIQSGQNLLLTFTNIQNKVGAGNNIFDQATQTMLDMSTALGQDTKSSAIQLGKALNDPVKGITALQRVGVSFTAGQKQQIAAMVASGNTMGAQKIILKELQKEFGGSAKAAGQTLGGQLNILVNTFDNLAASLLTAILPSLQSFIGIVTSATKFLSAHETTTKVLIATVAGLATAVFAVNAATKVWTAFTTAATVAQLALNAVLRANPLLLIISLIAAVAAGLVIAYQRSQTFRSIVQAAFNAVKVAVDAVKTAVSAVVSAIIAAKDHPVVRAIVLYYTTQFRLIKGAVELVIDAVRDVVSAVRTASNSPAISAVRQAFGDAWSAIKSVINSVASAIQNVIDKVNSAINAIGSLLSKAKNIGGGVLSKLPGFANGGIVTQPTLATVGESGPEVILPLNRPSRAAELMRQAGLTPSGGGAGVTVVIQNMNVTSPADIDRIASGIAMKARMAGAW